MLTNIFDEVNEMIFDSAIIIPVNAYLLLGMVFNQRERIATQRRHRGLHHTRSERLRELLQHHWVGAVSTAWSR